MIFFLDKKKKALTLLLAFKCSLEHLDLKQLSCTHGMMSMGRKVSLPRMAGKDGWDP